MTVWGWVGECGGSKPPFWKKIAYGEGAKKIKKKTNNSAFSATHTYIKLTLISFFLLFFLCTFPLPSLIDVELLPFVWKKFAGYHFKRCTSWIFHDRTNNLSRSWRGGRWRDPRSKWGGEAQPGRGEAEKIKWGILPSTKAS